MGREQDFLLHRSSLSDYEARRTAPMQPLKWIAAWIGLLLAGVALTFAICPRLFTGPYADITIDAISVDKDGQYPVNAALLSGLAIGLLYFNEILFALLARTATAVQPARSVTSEHFLWFSAGLGGLVWLGVVVVNLRLNLLRKPGAHEILDAQLRFTAR